MVVIGSPFVYVLNIYSLFLIATSRLFIVSIVKCIQKNDSLLKSSHFIMYVKVITASLDTVVHCGLEHTYFSYKIIIFCKIQYLVNTLYLAPMSKANKHVRNQSLICLFVCFWHDSPQWARASSFTLFLDHAQWCIAVSRTPPDKWSELNTHWNTIIS